VATVKHVQAKGPEGRVRIEEGVGAGRNTVPGRLRGEGRRDFGSMLTHPVTGPLAFLVLISVIMSVTSSGFLTVQNWYSMLNQAVFIVILGVGMTVVLISGGVDLSVGSILALCGGVAAALLAGGTPMVVAFVAALALGTGLGIINGLVITKLGIPDFVATLAMLGVARGALYVWTQAQPILNYTNDAYNTIAGLNRVIWYITVPVLIAIIVAVVVAGMLRWTLFGRHVYGVGSNSEAAKLSGINVARVKIAAYALSGFLAAGTGILLAGRLTEVQPDMGTNYELTAIAAAVMGGAALSGGRGSVFGACVGAVVLTVIQSAINILNLDPNWVTLVVGVLILLAVMLQRGGVVFAARHQRSALALQQSQRGGSGAG